MTATKVHDVHAGRRVKLVALQPRARFVHVHDQDIPRARRVRLCNTYQQGADDDHVALLDVRWHVPEHGENADRGKVEQAERKREPVKGHVVADQHLAAAASDRVRTRVSAVRRVGRRRGPRDTY